MVLGERSKVGIRGIKEKFEEKERGFLILKILEKLRKEKDQERKERKEKKRE